MSTTRGRGGGTVVDLEPPTPGSEPGAGPGSAESRRPELLDALVFRRVVEPGACFVASTVGRSATDLDQVRAAHDRVRAAGTPAEHRQADSRLHLAIAALTGSAYLVDAVTASTAFEGVLAALLHRERTGEGQLVTVNMLDAITTLQMQELSVFTVGGLPQTRSEQPHAHVYIRSPYGAFKTADGYLVLAFPPLKTLGEILGEDSFLELSDEDAGWTQRDELFATTAAHLEEEPTQHWLDAFAAAGIWAGPVYGYADLLADPQIAHNGTFVTYDHPTEGTVTTPGFPYRFSATPPRVDRGAPLTGQHTREVLTEIGLSAEQIDGLFGAGVVVETPLDPAGGAS